MKKKIFSIVLLFAFLIPCLTLLTACGKIKRCKERMKADLQSGRGLQIETSEKIHFILQI